MKKFADTACRVLSIALNLFIVCAEPIALPMSWDWGKEQMFLFYIEDSNIFAVCVCAGGGGTAGVYLYGQRAAPLTAHPQVHCRLLPDHDIAHGHLRAGAHV